jgi:hypothetical protein
MHARGISSLAGGEGGKWLRTDLTHSGLPEPRRGRCLTLPATPIPPLTAAPTPPSRARAAKSPAIATPTSATGTTTSLSSTRLRERGWESRGGGSRDPRWELPGLLWARGLHHPSVLRRWVCLSQRRLRHSPPLAPQRSPLIRLLSPQRSPLIRLITLLLLRLLLRLLLLHY